MNYEQVVVRIFEGRPHENGTYRGSAFLVGPGQLMTARHVIEPTSAPLFAEGPAFNGGIRPIEQIEHHSRSDRDVSVLRISNAVETKEFVRWSASRPSLHPGTKVAVIGYGTTDSDVEIKFVSCQGYQGYDDAVSLSDPVSPGMSGGAAIVDDLLAGVVWAFDPDGHRSFVTPITSVRTLLARYGAPPVSENAHGSDPPVGSKHYLLTYNIHVALRPDELPPELWEAFARLIPLGFESNIINKANRDRLE